MRWLVDHIDNALVRHGPHRLQSFPKLLILTMHTVFKRRAELQREVMHPQQRLLLSELREAIEVYKSSGFRFVSASEVTAGLPTNEQHCLLTFDDGYYNNLEIVPLLQEYDIPAIYLSLIHI